jgi:predicted DNA-binding protein (MmcQ/YjbR family)
MSRTLERDALPRLRALCNAHADATEKQSHGEASWFVGGRWFVTYADHHHDDRVGFWAAAPPGAQEVLVENEPGVYFRPPYVGHRGWIGMWLDVPTDWDDVARRVREAYQTIAGARHARSR